MRNIISGFVYFITGSAVLLLILIVISVFSSDLFDFSQSDEPVEHDDQDMPEAEAVAVSGARQSVRLRDAEIYDGDFELPVTGATGYAVVHLDMHDEELNIINAARLDPGRAFLILRENGEWWQIYDGGVTGWVRHAHCMINLPDVIPSVIYDNTNAYDSQFRINGENIPDITGERLYSYSDRTDGRAWNQRLRRYEYIVPVLYVSAKKIYHAQQNALANGDTLIIYEGYRPRSVQESVFGEEQRTKYQSGCAVNAGLAKVISTDYMLAGGYKYPKLNHLAYSMPTAMHELSVDSAVYISPGSLTPSDRIRENIPVQNLRGYFREAGFMPETSAWWRFSDRESFAALTRPGNGRYHITECLSIAP
jgi:D-alanyl-D-alanine dipeptidase